MISHRLVVRRAPQCRYATKSKHALFLVTAPVLCLYSCGRAIACILPEQATVAPCISLDLHQRQRNRGRYSIRRRRRALTTHWVRLVVSSFRIAFLT